MIGERIRQLREANGYGLTEFAEMIGEKKQNLYKYERNIITNIPLEKIERMASVLCVSPSSIIGWTDNPYSVSNPTEKLLIDKFRDLNAEGKTLLVEYADFLLGKYTK